MIIFDGRNLVYAELLSSIFRHRLKDITPDSGDGMCFLVKVKKIDDESHKPLLRDEEFTMPHRRVLVSDGSLGYPVYLYLSGVHCRLAKPLFSGDFLAIYCPKVRHNDATDRRELSLFYGDSTILFCISNNKTNADTSNGDDLNDEVNIHSRMTSFSLFGVITYCHGNSPLQDVETSDRFGFRLVDDTGALDVTLWGNTGLECKDVQKGESVLMVNLGSSRNSGENGEKFYVFGSEGSGTRVYRVAKITGILTSFILWSTHHFTVPIVFQRGTFFRTHTCGRAVDGECGYCFQAGSGRDVPKLGVLVDDGNGMSEVLVGSGVFELLAIRGHEFAAFTPSQRYTILNRLLGRCIHGLVFRLDGFVDDAEGFGVDVVEVLGW
ncbi:hypothetical protein BC829DRAFT_391830 [Chytridium lagenaria]|nr:hypothetical protein BC829DRAFT_391830 [Chytridium lagenaria]